VSVENSSTTNEVWHECRTNARGFVPLSQLAQGGLTRSISVARIGLLRKIRILIIIF